LARLDELRFMARIAQRYYADGQRQPEIARNLSISQATVSRMLKRARDEGIVRISVSAPRGTYPDLEAALRDRFPISEAIVVDCAEDTDGAIMARIGEAAAHLLETTMNNGEVIGISPWSQTILRMIDNVHPMSQRRARLVIQLAGGRGNPSVEKHATHLVTRLARLTNAEPVILQTPSLAASRDARLVLVGDAFVREAMDQFDAVTLAFLGLGAVEPSDMLAESGNVFSAVELRELEERGAVAEIGHRFLDVAGDPVITPLDDRVIGIDLDQLRRIPRVVALAGGIKKTRAIEAAMKSGVIDALVTDRFTAARLASRDEDLHAWDGDR
jgi:DNA-binding transcriptional regulator LsrR (DeoR family)